MLLLLLACKPEPSFSDESNLCGTIDRSVGQPAATEVYVSTIVEGHTPCSDTGGAGWVDEVVDTLTPENDAFEATVDPGTYAVEVATAGDYSGCTTVDVPDTTTCSGEVTVEITENSNVDKPNLYLYPTARTTIDVRLPAWRRVTESDPRYPVDGWRVTAEPDGRLETAAGDRDFLFYEMRWPVDRFQTEQGWCVQAPLAQLSIESAMGELGFQPNEIADFATGWDGEFPEAAPGPDGRAMMTVYPQLDQLATVNIDPAPDSFLRAWFYVAPGCQAVDPVDMPHVDRVGFHAAEWGVAFEPTLQSPDVVVHGG